jgi:hypothetical protein
MSMVDDLNQTLENLVAVRLEISRNPKPSYTVGPHTFEWTEYMKWLGDEIGRVRKELAQMDPVEEIGVAW